jgi:hypothetical protein
MTRNHRVGTFTLGSMLVTFGILFLLHIFNVGITFDIIFKLWPFILIFLGVEILIANFIQRDDKILYDKVAIFLTIVLSFFAMGMALIETCIAISDIHYNIRF